MKGCITKRGRDTWAIVFYLPKDGAGKRKQKWITVRGTYEDAEAKREWYICHPQVLGFTSDQVIYRKPSHLYVVAAEATSGTLVKIGVAYNVERRLKDLRSASPIPLKLVCVIENAAETERELHKRFSAQREHHEWFRLEGDLAEWLDGLR